MKLLPPWFILYLVRESSGDETFYYIVFMLGSFCGYNIRHLEDLFCIHK